jgi:predicted TIM-barrel fold metal-dependent hydrolase
MDKAGIDIAALTTNFTADTDEVKQWNDAVAKVTKENPARFFGLAPAQPLGGKAAFREIERAVKQLGMNGIHIISRPGAMITKPWKEYFKKLHFSMAGREVGIAIIRGALTTIKPEKLMFATDWTWNFEDNPRGAKKYIAETRKLDLSGREIDRILGDNAAKLMGL